jgi:hypothetical protein
MTDKTRRIGIKTLQLIDCQETGGVPEGQKLPVYGPPGRACGIHLGNAGSVWSDTGRLGRNARLCGHVGQGVGGGSDGEEALPRDSTIQNDG